jgi:tripartite-type tricarboxylate transporter receptor subunit TctC
MTTCIVEPSAYLPTRRAAMVGMAGMMGAGTAIAQTDWPSREVHIVLGFPAGGGVDQFARVLADQLTGIFGKTFVVDNKPGAGGLIGVKAVSQAPADGYTLAYIGSGHVTVQALNPRLDLLKEFKMVARLSHSPFAMVVKADSPYKTAQELIAAVQAQPGKLSYGSGGIGSAAHLAVELIEDRLTNFKALHVPYKGAIDTANAMVGGQVDFTVSLLGPFLNLVQSGKLRLLGVTTADRLSMLPNIPTLAESAVPGFVFEPWGGLAFAAGTSDAIVTRLEQALPRVMASVAMKDLMLKQGSIAQLVDRATWTAQIQRDIPLEQALVKRLGMTGQP